jgi:4a-hydroxytetrahydrobiopterin dehydratase
MRLGRNRIKSELAETNCWRLRGKQIARHFAFEDFATAMRFLNRVARLAEGMNHHPDIDIRYNRIKLTLTTHDEGGLTIKDFKLARRINKLVRRGS